MELLERQQALATLVDAREATERGEGRVVFVTGEPGIGKTSLVTRFLRDLRGDARVLFGTCDDLSIPRPLVPIMARKSSITSCRPRIVRASPRPPYAHQRLRGAERRALACPYRLLYPLPY
jgi:predicted ATPase